MDGAEHLTDSLRVSLVPDPSRLPDGRRLEFLELWRLGAGGWRSVAAGFFRLVVYFYGGMHLLMYAVAYTTIWIAPQLRHTVMYRDAYAGLGWLGKPIYLLSLSLLGALAVWHTLRYSEHRPFLSVVSPDLTFDWRRAVRGCLAWMAACLAVTVLTLPFDDGWPTVTLRVEFLLFLPFALVVIPLQSAAEEVVFRGWIAQVFGRVTSSPLIGSMFVAILFAAVHGSVFGPLSFLAYITMSLALSFVTVRDQRLELAIGAHTGNNLVYFLVMQRANAPVPTPTLLTCPAGEVDLVEIAQLVVAAGVFAYLALRPRRESGAAPASRTATLDPPADLL